MDWDKFVDSFSKEEFGRLTSAVAARHRSDNRREAGDIELTPQEKAMIDVGAVIEATEDIRERADLSFGAASWLVSEHRKSKK